MVVEFDLEGTVILECGGAVAGYLVRLVEARLGEADLVGSVVDVETRLHGPKAADLIDGAEPLTPEPARPPAPHPHRSVTRRRSSPAEHACPWHHAPLDDAETRPR